ncbi:MAG: DMT family transporter, partial [Acidobacteria bacterium]|nr:DMT family transporter [Acidobacteriota bacterium]
LGDSADTTHPTETQQSRRNRPRRTVLLGLLCATGAAAAYGAGHTVARHVVTSAASAPVTATYTLFFGMLMLFAISARHLRRDLKAPRSALIMMALAGVWSSLGIFFMYTALSRAPVTLASPIVAAYPLIAMMLTHIFLRRLERVTARMVWGAVLVAIGITFVILGRAG